MCWSETIFPDTELNDLLWVYLITVICLSVFFAGNFSPVHSSEVSVISGCPQGESWQWSSVPLSLSLFFNVSAPSFGCQPGWYRHGNSCYYFSYLWMYRNAWKTASSNCIDKDADLAIVDSPEKLQFLTSIAHALKLSDVFLGSRDTIKVSHKWSLGPPVNGSLWGAGVSPTEKCVGLASKSSWCGWWWVDLPCERGYARYGYICEIPLGENVSYQGFNMLLAILYNKLSSRSRSEIVMT